MRSVGVELLLSGQIKENIAWAWREVTSLHHTNQILCVIVVKSSYHLDIDRESIY